MKRLFTMTLLSLVLGSSVQANMVVDQVGGQAMDTFTFNSTGATYEVTIMWVNGGADLLLATACEDGVDDPMPFGAAGASQERFATFKAGVPPGLVCAVVVTAAKNGSKYWLSIRSETDEATSRAGRQPRNDSLRRPRRDCSGAGRPATGGAASEPGALTTIGLDRRRSYRDRWGDLGREGRWRECDDKKPDSCAAVAAGHSASPCEHQEGHDQPEFVSALEVHGGGW